MFRALATFLFDSGSPRVMAVFRIAFCAALLGGRIACLPDVELFFADTGLIPNDLLSTVQMDRFWSVLHMVDSPSAVFAMQVAYMVVIVAVMFGLYTRSFSVLLFVLAVSFRWRNPLITNSGDQVLLVAVFWLMFADSGHSWSLDSWLRRLRRAEPRRWLGCWGMRALQLQLCFIYGGSTLFKLRDPDWIHGDTMFYVAGLVFDFPVFWISLMDHPVLYKTLTWGSLLWELTFPILVWLPRMRLLMVVLGIAFHAIIGFRMGLYFFSAHMCALLLLFSSRSSIRISVPRAELLSESR